MSFPVVHKRCMSKKKFKKSLLLLTLIFVFLPLFYGQAQPPPGSFPNPITATSFTGLAEKIITWIINIGISVAVIMIIYSALLFMTSAGNEEKVSKARKALTWSIIGLAILISSRAFIVLIKNILGAS